LFRDNQAGKNRIAPPLPMYYLYFHGVELALKSFFYFKQQDDKELKRIGHDLKEAWKIAVELHIEEIYQDNGK